MKFIRLSRKTTIIVIAVLAALFAYHMFDIFVMRDHLSEMWEYDAQRLPVSHMMIEYNKVDGERMVLYNITDIKTVSDMVKYSNEFTRTGWKYYHKPEKTIPIEFYSYNSFSGTDHDYLVATAYMDDSTYLITKLTLGPSNEDFSYSLEDFDGLFEDIEELEITNLCLYKPEDVDGLKNMPALRKVYLHNNKVGDLPVANAIKEKYPNLIVYYGPAKEEVTLEMTAN